MTNVLDRICAEKRIEISERQQRRPLPEVERAALGRGEPTREFRAALARASATGYGLIAEINGVGILIVGTDLRVRIIADGNEFKLGTQLADKYQE